MGGFYLLMVHVWVSIKLTNYKLSMLSLRNTWTIHNIFFSYKIRVEVVSFNGHKLKATLYFFYLLIICIFLSNYFFLNLFHCVLFMHFIETWSSSAFLSFLANQLLLPVSSLSSSIPHDHPRTASVISTWHIYICLRICIHLYIYNVLVGIWLFQTLRVGLWEIVIRRMLNPN